jgi:ribonuclease BN (tRNA processing enzyme)
MTNAIEQSLQLSRSISRLALIGVLFAITNGIHVLGKASPEAWSVQVATGQPQEFYISLSTDERDQPGLSTLVVAGSNRFMFDCGTTDSVPAKATASSAATALFLTHLDTATADGIDRARGNARAASALRIWGPPGTREWILETVVNRALEDKRRRPLTVIDVREGAVSETGNVTVAAIETAPSRLAYRLGFEGRSVLIASDVTYSDHVVSRSKGVDIVVFRHSDITETVRLLQRIRPRLAVLSPDGKPATVAQIREQYAGPIQLFGAGAHRIHVREHLALENDIKEPQR